MHMFCNYLHFRPKYYLTLESLHNFSYFYLWIEMRTDVSFLRTRWNNQQCYIGVPRKRVSLAWSLLRELRDHVDHVNNDISQPRPPLQDHIFVDGVETCIIISISFTNHSHIYQYPLHFQSTHSFIVIALHLQRRRISGAVVERRVFHFHCQCQRAAGFFPSLLHLQYLCFVSPGWVTSSAKKCSFLIPLFRCNWMLIQDKEENISFVFVSGVW